MTHINPTNPWGIKKKATKHKIGVINCIDLHRRHHHHTKNKKENGCHEDKI